MDDGAAGTVRVGRAGADERRTRIVVFPFLLPALALLVVLGVKRSINPDEVESIRAAWKLLRGQMIYRDFFEHHDPLFYVLLSPLVAILPERAAVLIWLREANLVLLGANLAMTFLIGRRLFGAAAGAAAVVLLATTHLAAYKMIELRPDNLQCLFGLIGYLLLMNGFDRPRPATLLASGVAFGLSFAVLQKAVFLLLPVGVIVALRLRDRLRPRDLALLAVGGLGAVVPFALWFAATGTLRLYWVLNFSLNMDQAYAAGPVETIRTDPQVFEVLVNSVVANATLWSFALVAALAAFWPAPGTDPRQVRLRREVVLVAVVLVGWVVAFNKYYWQYYTPALPFVAILAGGAVAEVLHRHRVALACVLLFACVGSCRDAVLAVVHSNGGQINGFKRTLALTRPGDLVIDTRQNYNLFRPDPLYSGFVHADGLVPKALKDVTGRSEDVLDVIAATHPVLVNVGALPPGAWPGDPRLAGYVELPPTPAWEPQLIRRLAPPR